MATRIYCDHCGNTVKDPRKFAFGPVYQPTQASHASQQLQYAAQQQQNVLAGSGGPGVLGNGAYGSGGGGGGLTAAPTHSAVVRPPADPQVEEIDLCPTCVHIWMARVRKLTQASDV